MKLLAEDLAYLCQLAEEAAQHAGALINSFKNTDFKTSRKEGGNTQASQIVTEVDYRCESLILEHLKDSVGRYDLAMLTEEKEDDKQRLSKDYFWCVDPMDGTLAFTESQPGYAVSIALVSQQGIPIIGVVYDPVKHTLYSAIKDQGACRNGVPWLLSKYAKQTTFTLPCDRSLVERNEFETIRQNIHDWANKNGFKNIQEIHHGGAVMNACWALESAPACYFKLPKPENGGGSFWDFAATACIYQEMGLPVCDFNGQALALNKTDSTFMNQTGVIFSTDKNMLDLILSLRQFSNYVQR